jgi:DHA2 family multidrug resistance protein
VRIMCGGIGTSIFQTAWDHRTILHHARLSAQANLYNPVFDQSIRQMGAAGFSQPQAYGLFNNMVTQQAAQLGVNDLFYVSAGIFVALIALIWITKPERAGGDAGAAAAAAH